MDTTLAGHGAADEIDAGEAVRIMTGAPVPMGADAIVVPRRRRWRGWWWKLPLLFVAFSVLQVLVLRFVDPPFSAFMVARQLDALVAGDTDFRIAHDWRDFERISSSLPLALVASEDQNFGNHHGFDFSAIEKAQVHNEKMIERAEKRGKPVRRLRGASTISQQTAKNLFLWQGRGPTRWLRKGLEVLAYPNWRAGFLALRSTLSEEQRRDLYTPQALAALSTHQPWQALLPAWREGAIQGRWRGRPRSRWCQVAEPCRSRPRARSRCKVLRTRLPKRCGPSPGRGSTRSRSG